jgi:hypothetical protein
MGMRRALPVYLALGLIVAGDLRARTLTAADGRVIEAEVLGFEGEKVRIRRADTGQTFTLPVEAFAEADREALRAEAAQATEKPAKAPPKLSAQDVAIEFTRVRFDARKSKVNVKMADGSTAKGLLEVTEEEWGYTVTLRNLTGAPVEGLRAEYRLFTKIDELKNSGRAPRIRRKAFALEFETLPAAGRISARTEFVTTRKTDLKGGYEWAGTGDDDTRDTLHGIWLRVYQGDELVLESASPSGLATGRWEDTEG